MPGCEHRERIRTHTVTVRPTGAGGRSGAEPPASLPNRGARGRDSGARFAPRLRGAAFGKQISGSGSAVPSVRPAFASLRLAGGRAGSARGAGSRGERCSSAGSRGKDGLVLESDPRSPRGSALSVSLEGRKQWKCAREESSVPSPGQEGSGQNRGGRGAATAPPGHGGGPGGDGAGGGAALRGGIQREFCSGADPRGCLLPEAASSGLPGRGGCFVRPKVNSSQPRGRGRRNSDRVAPASSGLAALSG